MRPLRTARRPTARASALAAGALLVCAAPGSADPLPGPAARPAARAAQEPDAAPAAEVRWYDVRALGLDALPDPEPVDLRLHLSAAALDALEPDGYDVPLEELPALGRRGWSDLLWECLGEEWEDDALQVEERGGALRVEAAARTHERLARVLAELEAHAAARIELDAWRVRPETLAALPGALLDAAEARAAIEAATEAAPLRGALRPGRRATLALSGFDAALYDYDVEVAGSSRAFDPQVTVLRLGAELGAVVRECPDGRLYVRAWARHGARAGAAREAALSSAGGARIELPTVRTALAAGSGLLADGGALVLGLDGPEGGGWIVRARRAGPPRAPAIVPLGALTTAPLVLPPARLEHAAPSGGWSWELDEFLDVLDDALREPLYEPLDLYEELRDVQERRGLTGALVALGDALYAPEDGALRALVAGRMRELAAVVGGTAAIELRYGLLPREAAAAAARGDEPGDRSELAALLPRRALGACRLGDTLLLVGGTQRSYLADVDVEIAEASAVGDPELELLFEGTGLWCMPAATTEGALSVWIDLRLHAPLRPPRELQVPAWIAPERGDEDPRPPGRFGLGETLELPATARAGLRGSHVLRADAWTLLGVTPLGADGLSLVAVARGRIERAP